MQKVMLITGGNRGIGLEICRQLAEQNHNVILTARDQEKGKTALMKLPSGVEFLQIDMNNNSTFESAKDFIENKYGRLDVLINNAGIISSGKGVDTAKMEEIRSVMETNFFGPVELTQTFLPLLKKSKEARIVNVSSGMGSLSEMGSGYAAYRMSKTALNSFTAILAQDLSSENIKVNSICPGWVRTDMGGSNASRSVEQGADTAVWLASADEIPDGKFLRDRKVIDW
ncbi:MAG: SDR family oxidoreductase [Calditrichaeota bacterium]|nr:MAG: SDR family NAD(P)-dependent oxidoreductase [Calditrichota bacterium]MBL1207643.1 SDR family oxidoreductase [Calditrichota bacterium]NOG47476.1 SDR family oxidoreductase [Calditrichota bacterium]